MKLLPLLKEVQQSTTQYFDNYSTNNKYALKVCRLLCRRNGIELDNQNDEHIFKLYGQLYTIPISKIQIGQDKVESNVLDKKDNEMNLNSYKPIHVFYYNGKLYLHDGHHRTVTLMNNGIVRVKGYIMNVNKLQ